MTVTAPPVAPATGRRLSFHSGSTRVGRSGPVAWMVLPALVMFVVFGVVPLVGVFVLSFTQWDGLGADPSRPACRTGRSRSGIRGCTTHCG